MSEKKHITISELYSDLVEEEYPIIDKDEKMVYVVAPQTKGHDAEHVNRLFLIVEDDPILLLEEVMFDWDKMAKQLTPGFDPEFLVKTALKEAPPSRLLEIKERLENPEAKVTTKPGCVSLSIGGKRGDPIELGLRK